MKGLIILTLALLGHSMLGMGQVPLKNGKGKTINGEKIGKWTYFYDNGKLLSEGYYNSGKQEGEWTFYYEDGKIKETGVMKANDRIGLWKTYDLQGNMDLNNYDLKSVSIAPNPPMELNKYLSWIAENYVIPSAALQVKGTVQVSFTVAVDGSLDSFQIINDIGFGTGEEFIRVLQMSDKWSPGILNGRPVRVSYTIPLKIN